MGNVFGQCKWRYALVNGIRTDIVDADKGVNGFCPLCGEKLVPRKGELRNWHWWHIKGRTCDDWYEPKGEWHRWWQSHFGKDLQERVLSREVGGQKLRHIADVHTLDGWTIEFQYSHLSMSKISEREFFYENMVWVVSGARLESDRCNGELLLHKDDFKESKNGFHYLALDSYEIEKVNQCWRERNKLVFFDFFGTFDKPSAGTDLLCLLPGDVEGLRLVVRLKQDQFLNGFINGNSGVFVDGLNGCLEEFRQNLILKHKFEAEEKARLLKEREDQHKQELEESWRFEIDHPAQYAITCGWIEGYLLMRRLIKCLIGAWDLSDIPVDGFMALHLKQDYARDEYNKDANIACKNYPVHLYDLPTYEKFQKSSGWIVAKFAYKVECDSKTNEWKLTIKEINPLLDYEENVRCVHDVPDGKDVWPLSDMLIAEVNDRKYKITHEPKCPICGNNMLLRHRKVDSVPFYGCKCYPKCKGTLSCNPDGTFMVYVPNWLKVSCND